MTKPFTFEVDEELQEAFRNAARNSGRTDGEALRDFMREFVESTQERADHDAWFREQVEAGRRAAEAGHLIDNSEIEQEFAARRDSVKALLET